MRFSEKIFIVLFAIGLIMKILSITGGGILLVFSVIGIVLMYTLFGFAFFNGVRFRKLFNKHAYEGVTTGQIISSTIEGLFLSISIIGVLFAIQNWIGARIMLTVGMFINCVLLIISIIGYRSQVQKRFLVRTVIILSSFILILIVYLAMGTRLRSSY